MRYGTIENGLNLILDQLDLGWIKEGDYILVSSPERIDRARRDSRLPT